MRKYVDLSGKTFNFLTVIEEVEPVYNRFNCKIRKWKCKCICGKEGIYIGNNLKNNSTKSCGCKKKEIILEKIIAYSNKKFQFSTEKNLYGHYKIEAEKRNLNFDIDFEYFKEKISCNCTYCGRIPYTIHKSKKKSRKFIIYNGLDCVNNKLGYQKDNLVTCCKDCNYLKGKFSHEDFFRIIKSIYEYSIINTFDTI